MPLTWHVAYQWHELLGSRQPASHTVWTGCLACGRHYQCGMSALDLLCSRVIGIWTCVIWWDCHVVRTECRP